MNRIEVIGVGKHYGALTALEDISFEVAEGELFGMIGPDGAGKTSLFRILVSLLLPSVGVARMAGYDVVKDFRKIRQLVGYMPGKFSLYQDLSVEENLNFFAKVFGTSLQQNYSLIKDIYSHIEPFKKRRAGALSGGMKQKLALSCALIHRPEVLVLDEPTTGVDAVSRVEFWDLLDNIRKEGISILVSTPYMDEASKCDRVGLIQKGRLLSVAKPASIKKSVKGSLFRLHPSSSNFAFLQKIRTFSICRLAWLAGQDIHIRLNDDSSENELLSVIQSIDPACACSKINPGIEDAFIELMEEMG
jgi:ABC-2 type transport system ATP-binding protein